MFSVGILYSSQTLLQIVSTTGVDTSNFSSSFARIEVADASVVLEVCQKCRWLRIGDDGSLQLTERGTFLLGLSEAAGCLREQLLDLISADPPPWARRIIQGRFEAVKAMPDAARQCFRDCGLTEGIDDEIVSWWDRASEGVRATRTRVNHDVGRRAERLTLRFEQERTGVEPIWQAVETNVSGFDVLSVVGTTSPAKLKIEVKGSSLRRKEASFFLTRNEWNTASASREYHFHLWLVHEVPALFVVPAAELESHVPTDGGSGRWETAQLFYRDFLTYESKDAVCG